MFLSVCHVLAVLNSGDNALTSGCWDMVMGKFLVLYALEVVLKLWNGFGKKGLETRKFISSSNFPQGVPAFVRIIIFYEGHRHRWQTALAETARFWGILIFHILSKQNCGAMDAIMTQLY